MRVRPIFWVLLVLACTGVLSLAYFMPTVAPAVLQVRVDAQHGLKPGLSYLRIQFTDEEGMPISDAKIDSQAYMTNMNMLGETCLMPTSEPGSYLVRVGFSMSGPWAGYSRILPLVTVWSSPPS